MCRLSLHSLVKLATVEDFVLDGQTLALNEGIGHNQKQFSFGCDTPGILTNIHALHLKAILPPCVHINMKWINSNRSGKFYEGIRN